VNAAELALEVAMRLGMAALDAHRRGELGALMRKRVDEILPRKLLTTVAKQDADAKARDKFGR
jgi:hypothetical protein